ncbi:hypothetical protein E3H47_00270 [Acinetobacter radioresistens]|uniref:oligosaccharide flippase family protein n=1 Tax=Acinetobacter radioresistens TaxID=40216 RepID=UPI0010CCEA5D|nr:polysaccharide biosynthesis C-terminal domain-containing protein [Acinetobacter radioresistens]QCS11044.1 hypothetical protein E3H47_00270 [Acinetobacter radioresistens]
MNISKILNSGLFRIFFGTFLFRILVIGITFVSSVLLARTLGVKGFGLYSYIFALVSILALPAQAGMPTLVLRETAKAKALSDWAQMKGIWVWAGSTLIIFSLFICALAFFVQKTFFNDIPGGFEIFALGLVMSLLIAMGNVRGAALRGLGFIIQGQLPEGLIRPLCLTFFLLIAVVLNIELSPNVAMSFHLFAAIIAFIIGACLLIRAKPKELQEVQLVIHGRTWFLAVLPLAVMTGMQSISGQIDILMLGFLASIKDVGVYKVVVSGASLALFGLQIVSTVITPRLASAFAKENYLEVQKIASIGSLISFFFTLPLVPILFFWGSVILEVIFGNEFIIGHRALYIIAIGQAINAFFGSSISILTMSGKEKFVIKGMFFSTIVNTILNLILIPRMGIDGAAISASISIVVWNLYLWVAIRHQIGIDSTFVWLFWRKNI